MAKIFITGSADGLGQLAAKELIKQGHEVVLHARNQQRAEQAMKITPGAKEVLIADLSDIEEVKKLAGKANAWGAFDVVIHNAGVYQTDARQLLTVNVLAPYILTCLMNRSKRLIYLSSGMHLSGKAAWTERPSYSDTKLYVLMLTKAMAGKWPDVYANAVDPGWVPTKMGGAGAPDDLQKGYETQVWLATADDQKATVSGTYFHHEHPARYHPAADDTSAQDEMLTECARLTGVTLIANPMQERHAPK